MSLFYSLFFDILDKGFFELIGPLTVRQFIYFRAKEVVKFQKGYIYNYVCFFIFSFIFVLFTITVFPLILEGFVTVLIDFEIFEYFEGLYESKFKDTIFDSTYLLFLEKFKLLIKYKSSIFISL